MNKLLKILISIISISTIITTTLMFFLKIDNYGNCLLSNTNNNISIMVENDVYKYINKKTTLTINNKISKFDVSINQYNWLYNSQTKLWTNSIDYIDLEIVNIIQALVLINQKNLFGMQV